MRNPPTPAGGATVFEEGERPGARTAELVLRCGCGASAKPRVVVRGGALEARCRFCGSLVSVAPEPERPVVRSGAGCPKCGAPRGERACPRCGLIYAKWRGPKASVKALGAEALTVRLWAEVCDEFADAGRHDRFLKHCLLVGALRYAAACYSKEEENPDLERAGIAKVRRQQVRVMAEAAYLHQPQREGERRTVVVRRALLFVGTLAVVSLILWMGTVVVGTHGPKRAAPGPGAAATEPPPTAPTRHALPASTILNHGAPPAQPPPPTAPSLP